MQNCLNLPQPEPAFKGLFSKENHRSRNFGGHVMLSGMGKNLPEWTFYATPHTDQPHFEWPQSAQVMQPSTLRMA